MLPDWPASVSGSRKICLLRLGSSSSLSSGDGDLERGVCQGNSPGDVIGNMFIWTLKPSSCWGELRIGLVTMVP